MGEISVKTGNNARNGGKNSLNRLIRCVCGKKIGPDPRNFNQRVSLGRNDLLIRTFPRYVVITGASLPSPKNKTVCLCAVMIPPDSFHGPVVYTKSMTMITCWTFNMLPTRLSPVTVDNQYIVSLAAVFPTICSPSPFFFVIGQCEK